MVTIQLLDDEGLGTLVSVIEPQPKIVPTIEQQPTLPQLIVEPQLIPVVVAK